MPVAASYVSTQCCSSSFLFFQRSDALAPSVANMPSYGLGVVPAATRSWACSAVADESVISVTSGIASLSFSTNCFAETFRPAMKIVSTFSVFHFSMKLSS